MLQQAAFVSAAQPAISVTTTATIAILGSFRLCFQVQYPPGLPIDPVDVTLAITFTGREPVLLPQRTQGNPCLH